METVRTFYCAEHYAEEQARQKKLKETPKKTTNTYSSRKPLPMWDDDEDPEDWEDYDIDALYWEDIEMYYELYDSTYVESWGRY